jgi:hypothetical protein
MELNTGSEPAELGEGGRAMQILKFARIVVRPAKKLYE